MLLSGMPDGQEGNATNLQTAYLGGATIPNSGKWNGAWSPLTLTGQGQVSMVVQPATAVIIDLQAGPSQANISGARSGNNLVITYTGTLLSATNVAGPYAPVAGASSPWMVPITNSFRFYRAQSIQGP
jgi:hypothetical protein